MDNLKEDKTEEVPEAIIFKEDPLEKVSQLELEIKKKFLNEIVEKFADDYYKENTEKEWLHFEREITEKIGNKIIEKYCSNFTRKVKNFLDIVQEVKRNNIIKKVKIGLAIGGGVLAVGGAVAVSVAFPAAPVAAAVITVVGADAAAIPFIAGVVAQGGGAITAAGVGLSALLSRWKKKDSFKKLTYLISPVEFVEGNVKFELCIGQVIYPLNIPGN